MNEKAEHKPVCRTCGFRFSASDGAVIVFCGWATWFAWARIGSLAILFPVALGHFFLFCNIFRIHRNAEFLWSALFIANFSAWNFSGEFTWFRVLALQSVATLLVIGREMRTPRYHGIFARSINRRHIEAWLEGDAP